jgi:hypothetical protein
MTRWSDCFLCREVHQRDRERCGRPCAQPLEEQGHLAVEAIVLGAKARERVRHRKLTAK